MESLRESIKAVLSVKDHEKKLSEFAIEKFQEQFKDKPKTYDGSWRSFKKYEILADHIIRIHYQYGYGDMEFDDSFDVGVQ